MCCVSYVDVVDDGIVYDSGFMDDLIFDVLTGRSGIVILIFWHILELIITD